jgi:hypothetical protein
MEKKKKLEPKMETKKRLNTKEQKSRMKVMENHIKTHGTR